jgi:hypothetical protein
VYADDVNLLGVIVDTMKKKHRKLIDPRRELDIEANRGN